MRTNYRRTGRARAAHLLTLALLLALALPIAAAAAPLSETSSLDPTAEGPCLVGDPFNLAKFAALVSDDTPPRGVQTINSDMTVEFVGEGKLLLPAKIQMPEEKAPDGERDPKEEDAPLYRQTQLRLFNSRTLNEFRIVMNQAMLDEIGDCHAKTGRQYGSASVTDPGRAENANALFLPLMQGNGRAAGLTMGLAGPPAPAVAPGGWSNGIDTRKVRTPTTLWPWRAIAQFRYGSTDESRCTGTLIGPRHLITAAHCINEQGTNNWYTVQVTPGKNGVGAGQAQQPYGSSTIKVNPDPGDEAWYFTPEPWRNPAQTGGQWDWGLIVIPDRLGDLTSWMGYVARPGDQLRNVNQLNRGYPLCDNDRGNQPANCQDSRLYGDSAYCEIGSFFAKGPDGWNRRFTVSCDLSGGHSGSAVYHYFYDASLQAWWPVVAAVVTHESCAKCGLADVYPNTVRRITPGDLNTISWLREVFP